MCADNYPPGTGPSDPRAPWNVTDEPPECPKCLTQLEPDWDFCPSCGSYIDWMELERARKGDDS